MNNELVKLPAPLTVGEVVAKLPPFDCSLGWGVQSMTADTVRAMVLLASSRSEHYRYALAASIGIAQYLFDMPEGSVTSRAHFVRSKQDGTRIGLFDNLDLHVIQEPVPEEIEEEYLMLLILNDDHLVDSYIVSRLRLPSDHVVQTIKLPTALS